MKNKWYKKSVFYQIYPRSFCDANGDGIGDIKGIISKLDYVKDLGADAIWFSPLYASPNADYGYDISDYCAINPEYGTMEDFDKMVEEMHKRGMKVVMDLVINHTSSKHKWFEESRKSKDNPYRDYYLWRDGKNHDGKTTPNNWTSFFIGPAWKYDETTNQWYLHLFDVDQPDLNYFNPKVLEEIENILRFWLDKGVDGFRCDVITLLSKKEGLPDGKPTPVLCGSENYIDGPEMKNILKKLQTDVLEKYDAFTVGESVMITVDKALRYIDEKDQTLSTIFAFDHMGADSYFGAKQLVRKFDLRILKKAIGTWQQGLYLKAWPTIYFENHDQARIVGRYCSDTVCRQEGAKMIANVEMCLTGTPFVYEGQEIAQTSARFEDVADWRDVESFRSLNLLKKIFGRRGAMKRVRYCSRDNARTPVQWDDSKNAGFTTADKPWIKVNPNYTEINVEQNLHDENSVLNYYKKIIALRKKTAVMGNGAYRDLRPKDRHLFVFEKTYQNDKLLCINNFSLKEMRFKPDVDEDGYKLLSANYADSPTTLKECTLRPYESLIYVKKN